jgi:hypothetical protein
MSRGATAYLTTAGGELTSVVCTPGVVEAACAEARAIVGGW